MLTLEALRTEIYSSQGIVTPVDGVSLHIQPGETFALVGESGSGKSVTAMSIARLLPDNGRIAGGDVKLGETGLADLSEREMRHYRGRRIGMIFQEPGTSLNAVLTVGKQIVEAIETHTALRGEAARAKAVDWLRRVGIPEPERRIDSYAFQLSGGQKQRVMIALALAAEPELLIADEPTTALDVTVQKQILDLLLDLQRERGMAILLITHDLGVVAQVADRVGIMYAGELVELASKEAFFSRPLHPYANRLLGALPDVDKRGHLLEAIAGSVPPLNQTFAGCRFAPRCHSATERCRSELPAMYEPQPAHTVRCFAYAAEQPVALQERPPAEPSAELARKARAKAPLLSVDKLRVRFPIRSGLLQRVTGYVDAVHEVSFDLYPGETLALVGESGSGKTTTGKAILQLLRGTAVVDGVARLGDVDLMHASAAELKRARRDIQIIFQDPFGSLNPRMRVGEILEEGIQALRPEIDGAGRRQRIAALLDQVGLPLAARDKYPHEFSGGQRQRIAIARALAVEPKLIVCDEPTSALDVSVQAQILNLLKDLQRELGVAYLFITHNIGVVEYLADHIAVMQSGRIVEVGASGSLLTAPNHAYTQTLLAAVPRAKLEDAVPA
ncbi:ABC transporter ATP-binding protein [Chitinimonas sp.]|uniref:ABC transporter ATP-binding protein n=1 Tax=Chitinimonas sp. TaxID=1934313 RepID=UPI002F9521A0